MKLPQRKLGSTDISVSAIGLGTVKFGRNTDVKYPRAFELPSDKQATELLALAKDLNINLLDTAPAYGLSEERLGKLLHGQRHNWIITGKAGEEYDNQQSTHNFTASHIMSSIKRSLQRLQTDYIDVLLIHSDGNDEKIIQDYDVFGTLAAAKQHGLIRAFGMSTKTVAGGLLTIEHADVAMVMCNPIYDEEIPVINHAHAMNKGIMVKKALASGHVDKLNTTDPIQAAMDYIFGQQGVHSIIIGTLNLKHITANVEAAIKALQT